MRDYWNGTDPELLTITTGPAGGASLVAVSGEVDVHSAPRLRAELAEVFAGPGGGPVVLDLTAVTFISSAGLATLVDVHHEAQQRGRSFALVVDHASAAVVQPLHTVGLAELITSYATLDEALAGERHE